MTQQTKPTISAVIAAYQSEPYLAEAIESILNQTRPPDEILVVDDGSTDGTPRVLESFGDLVRVIRQENAGYQAAMNRAIIEARSQFVALCGADDIWEPKKLEWQEEAISSHPEIDVFFGHFKAFGDFEALGGRFPDTQRPPAEGALENDVLRDTLLRHNVICTPFVVMRRDLFERIGSFVVDFKGDDYDYWFRCLDAGVRFYYDSRLLGWHRRHDRNLTNDLIGLYRAMNAVRFGYAYLVEDRRLLREVIATDYFKIGRLLADDGRAREARREFRQALRWSGLTGPWTVRALGWLVVLTLPSGAREQSANGLVRASRMYASLRRLGQPASS